MISKPTALHTDYGENSLASNGRGRKTKYYYIDAFQARVCMKQNLNAQSTAKTKETVPEVNQRGGKAEKQSNTEATLYKAPHARNALTGEMK